MKILVCTPFGGAMGHYRYMQSMLADLFLAPDRLKHQTRYDVGFYLQGGASGLGKDRDIMASHALRAQVDKLVFIDSDQSWEWEDFRKLVDSDKPVVAGMVPLKSHPIQLNFTTRPEDAPFFDAEGGVVGPKGIDRLRAAKKIDELQVSAAGTGFMCIDIRKTLVPMIEQELVEPFVYTDLADPTKKKLFQCWDFFPSGPVDNNYYGEDYGFCILAQRAGASVWVNTSVEIPHHGGYEYKISQGRLPAGSSGNPLQPSDSPSEVDPRQAPLPFPSGIEAGPTGTSAGKV